MTKTIALALLLALAACKDKKKDPAPVEPTPMPTTGSGSATTPVTPKEPPIALKECELKIDVKVGGLAWKSPTAEGAMADGIDPAQVTAATKTAFPLGTPCHALIDAEDKVVYQDIITVMDAVIAGGIEDVQLDIKGAAPTGAKNPAPPDLKSMPVVGVTADAVLVNNKEVGKLADAKLDAALATAFADAKKASPDAGQIILQADKTTTWADLTRIVGAATTAGFGDVLFAIKNK